MLKKLRSYLKRFFISAIAVLPFLRGWFLKYVLSESKQRLLMETSDPVRFGSILLAINNIEKSGISGAFAEAGVYKGDVSKFIHNIVPGKNLYLFDTFEGFPKKLLKGAVDGRFDGVSLEAIKENIGNLDNVVFVKGYFPDSAINLKDERFSFVMIDFDLYESTLSALEYFYPKVNQEGYIFLHDYNSPESGFGVSRAANEFFGDKPEKIIEIPDSCGTAIVRKL